MNAREQYMSFFSMESEAIEFEREVLSREDLPECALAVRDKMEHGLLGFCPPQGINPDTGIAF